jgi:methionyl-tRNA synthetase
MVQTAEKEGKQVMEYLDEIALGHKQTWDDLNISYTDFIRTTEQRHKEFVQNILTKTKEARTTT